MTIHAGSSRASRFGRAEITAGAAARYPSQATTPAASPASRVNSTVFAWTGETTAVSGTVPAHV